MNKTREKNLDIQQINKNKVRKLEEFYVNGTISDLSTIIEEEKEKKVQEMIEYAKRNEKCVKWSRDGDELDHAVIINPIVINNYFFKSIIPINCQEPIYNAEKLSLVYDYYCYLIAEVNDKIAPYPSSLTTFCKFAGLTLSTLRNYKNSADINMRVIVEKIYDQIGDDNITFSQMGIAKERTTMFKMKVQNEMIEKVQPQVKINITELPDLERINERLNQYSNFSKKRDKK